VLTKTTKDALNKARGDQSYSKFIQSLFVPNGVFSQFEKQKAQLESERAALEKERKNLNAIERFTVTCKVCGKPLIFNKQKMREKWDKNVKPILDKAFSTYYHVPDCRPKQ
jgi:DNA repair exonuclease SbcCD ATPase subunit